MYRGDLNTGLVWYSNGQKLSDRQNGPLFKCHLNPGLNLVQYSDHHLNTGHLNTKQVKVHYSDFSVIQIPTVLLN